VTEVVPVVDPVGVIGRGCRQEADLRVGFAGECDHLSDKSFLQCAAEGKDGAGLSVRGGGEEVYGDGQQECFFHRDNVRIP